MLVKASQRVHMETEVQHTVKGIRKLEDSTVERKRKALLSR